MINPGQNHLLTHTVDELADLEVWNIFQPRQGGGKSGRSFALTRGQRPSGEALAQIVSLARAILFPGYYGKSNVNQQTLKFQIGVNVEQFQKLLAGQIYAGLSFCDNGQVEDVAVDAYERNLALRERSEELSLRLTTKLPDIRKILLTDVVAAYNGDPAAKSFSEIISCYPVIKALVNYRIAHELFLKDVPLIPRMLTEMAHSETGIDIHPGAAIGSYFTIDHGTGVVIGETCTIGTGVKLYQGVTLGAKSFPLDADGNPIKGIPRHPHLGDNVVVYANATVLGNIHIGDGCVIGANTWVMEDMAPNTRKYKKSNKTSLTRETEKIQ